MAIKQRIFKHLGGEQTIIQLIKKGLLIFDTYPEAFEYYDAVSLPKYKLDIAETVVLLFRACHSILSLFCIKSHEYQAIVAKDINVILRNKIVDVGQIDLMIEIYKNNHNLCDDISDNILLYFLEMIQTHGRKQKFLEVFQTIITHEEDISDIKKKILMSLFKDQYFDEVNVLLLLKSSLLIH